MTGSDFLFWLEGIWFDLTNLGTADLPSLFFRLVLLFALVFFGMFFVRVVLTVLRGLLRSYVLPLLSWCWSVLTAPVRLPWRLLMRVWRRLTRTRGAKAYARAELKRKEQQEAERLAAERRERERIAELRKVLKVD